MSLILNTNRAKPIDDAKYDDIKTYNTSTDVPESDKMADGSRLYYFKNVQQYFRWDETNGWILAAVGAGGSGSYTAGSNIEIVDNEIALKNSVLLSSSLIVRNSNNDTVTLINGNAILTGNVLLSNEDQPITANGHLTTKKYVDTLLANNPGNYTTDSNLSITNGKISLNENIATQLIQTDSIHIYDPSTLQRTIFNDGHNATLTVTYDDNTNNVKSIILDGKKGVISQNGIPLLDNDVVTKSYVDTNIQAAVTAGLSAGANLQITEANVIKTIMNPQFEGFLLGPPIDNPTPHYIEAEGATGLIKATGTVSHMHHLTNKSYVDSAISTANVLGLADSNLKITFDNGTKYIGFEDNLVVKSSIKMKAYDFENNIYDGVNMSSNGLFLRYNDEWVDHEISLDTTTGSITTTNNIEGASLLIKTPLFAKNTVINPGSISVSHPTLNQQVFIDGQQGMILASGTPTLNNHLTTKEYVDSTINAVLSGNPVTNSYPCFALPTSSNYHSVNNHGSAPIDYEYGGLYYSQCQDLGNNTWQFWINTKADLQHWPQVNNDEYPCFLIRRYGLELGDETIYFKTTVTNGLYIGNNVTTNLFKNHAIAKDYWYFDKSILMVFPDNSTNGAVPWTSSVINEGDIYIQASFILKGEWVTSANRFT